MPPNAPIIVPQMMPNNVSITVGKKQHTLKNTVMSLPNKFIVFLGRTFSGHNHDYLMLKQEFPPELDWFTDINVRVDLGYLGIQADYKGALVQSYGNVFAFCNHHLCHLNLENFLHR
jgi:hypothetical protein